MPRILSIALFTLFFACQSNYFQIQSDFSRSIKPPAPVYGNRAHWASLPDKKDAADSIPHKSNLKDQQAQATADVFFV
ncbi:MAG: hypothetical protein ACKODM_10395, partial [Cytophagales bacterium]